MSPFKQKEKTAYKTQVARNADMAKFQAAYIFPEIARKRDAHLQKHPDAKVISLGHGDTTEPIPEVITSAMKKRSQALSTLEGYSGYGPAQGEKPLRAAIASTFYDNLGIEEDDIFVSDCAKCDISRLQLVFGSNVTMAVQSPSYPILEKTGSGFGPGGEGFFRVSAFGHMSNVLEACKRFKQLYK